jgi:acyl-CoA thioesterase FadM
MFHALGLAENDLGDGRIGIIMGDLAVTYCSGGDLFDKLSVDSHVGEMGHRGFRIFQRLVREGTVIALVETGIIAYDYTARAITPFPKVFTKALKRYLYRERDGVGTGV